ncbi:MAG: phage antirepressor [Lentisphaerota bacterium]
MSSNSFQMSVFSFEQAAVRVVNQENGPWFVAADVCKVLKIKNTKQACDQLDEDEKGISKTYTPGGAQDLLTISESGLYALIMRSNKPNAKVFRKWVTSEVLPAIRQTGSFSATGKPAPTDPLEIVEMALAGMKQERARANLLQQENAAMKPLADYAEDVLFGKNLVTMNVIAAEIGTSAVKLYQFLKSKEVLYKTGKTWYTFSNWRDLGLFGYATHKFVVDGEAHSVEYLKVTQKGRAFIKELWKYHGGNSERNLAHKVYQQIFEPRAVIPCSQVGVDTLLGTAESVGDCRFKCFNAAAGNLTLRKDSELNLGF